MFYHYYNTRLPMRAELGYRFTACERASKRQPTTLLHSTTARNPLEQATNIQIPQPTPRTSIHVPTPQELIIINLLSSLTPPYPVETVLLIHHIFICQIVFILLVPVTTAALYDHPSLVLYVI